MNSFRLSMPLNSTLNLKGKEMSREEKKWATADCETNPFEHGAHMEPFIWGFYDGKVYRRFFSTVEFVEFIKGFNGIIYMHNGGKFDCAFLTEHFSNPLLIINGRVAKVRIGDCELRDSWSILPTPLRDYAKDSFDYNKNRPELRDLHMEEIEHYLRNDCIFLYEYVNTFVSQFGHTLTLASAAMRYWQSNYDDSGIKNLSGEKGMRYRAQFAPFYYGGRVECFESGMIETPFKVYDINSAYPYAMSHDMPYGFHYSITDEYDKENSDRAFFIVDATPNGCFPFRDEKGNLSFPRNRRDTYHVTGWELNAGIDTNSVKIHSIIKAYYFKETVNFTGYVKEFYGKKARYKDVDNAQYNIAKLMMNSLYGKFSADAEKYKEAIICTQSEMMGYITQKERPWEPNAFEPFGENFIGERELSMEKLYYFNIATGASITGFGRAYLWRAISASTRPLYCDTDSLACISAELPVGRKLGQWELEADCDTGAIAGKKMYAFRLTSGKWKIASKGVRLKAADIVRVASGESVEYKSEFPTFGLKTGFRYITRNIRNTACNSVASD